ncbi:Alcohol oxidase Short=AOX [Rhizoctonia solani AG-1 IB]|uniref:Alcohol oxidase Short=AOX n=1 Tax=Thanatephorus cucumeris (strain AG1-IB / isolate 7/3/14) TaxID=1108050 RepID=M5C9N9_THACB|nr:Alcohol oxidase Short=AOX [Rhizoctonia solani AG-1 IB]
MHQETDIIFVGGGTAACVAAGRLAASNPGLEILVVEQGSDNFKDPSVTTPALYLTHADPESKNTIHWKGTKSDAANGRETGTTSGGILGGGSSINFMMYAQPAASDFDDWNAVGWSAKDLIPLFQKNETYHVAPGLKNHGYDGPVNISYSDYFAKVAQEYLGVCATMGIPPADDLMDFQTGHGSGRLAKYIHPVTGQRQDAAHLFIHTQSHNKSLRVMTKALVTRVLFEGTKAIGVEITMNKNQDPNADQTPQRIYARKLVVISSGAISTALVLQRSGVGDATLLTKLGIDVVVNLPSVGSEYQDHGMCLFPFYVPKDTETCNSILTPEPGYMEAAQTQFKGGKGFLTSNFSDAGSKIRPTPDELKELGPAFNQYWKERFESAPDKPAVIQVIFNGFFGPPFLVPEGLRLILCANFLGYPMSRGHVYISSADPYAPPNFRSGLIEEQADVEFDSSVDHFLREVARRMPSYRGEPASLHPKFPEGSVAGCVRLDEPPPKEQDNLVYTPEDDKVLEDFIRQSAEATPHSVGTVQMAPKAKGGCVDDRLNTTNILTKSTDLSILPGSIGANSYSTALMVGEKAAILIAEDLGLNLP